MFLYIGISKRDKLESEQKEKRNIKPVLNIIELFSLNYEQLQNK